MHVLVVRNLPRKNFQEVRCRHLRELLYALIQLNQEVLVLLGEPVIDLIGRQVCEHRYAIAHRHWQVVGLVALAYPLRITRDLVT